jgi:hypothetical protein
MDGVRVLLPPALSVGSERRRVRKHRPYFLAGQESTALSLSRLDKPRIPTAPFGRRTKIKLASASIFVNIDLCNERVKIKNAPT